MLTQSKALFNIMESFVNFRFDLLQLVNKNNTNQNCTKKPKSDFDHQVSRVQIQLN